MTAIPPMEWCGVDHPHAPHVWTPAAHSTVSIYAQCPGSTGPAPAVDECDDKLETGDGAYYCTRPLGHRGPHREGNGPTEWRRAEPS